MKHAVALTVILFAGLIFVGACSKRDAVSSSDAALTREDLIKRDLQQNGVIEYGWSVSENDGDIDSWPASVFARATYDAQIKLKQILSEWQYIQTKVHIVPDVGGYQIIVLAHERPTSAQQEQIRDAADAALNEAHRLWLSKKMKSTEPNKALVPTTASVTPAADAPVAPAAAAAHL